MKQILINGLALGIGIWVGGNGCATHSTNAPEAWAGLAWPSAFGGGEAKTNAPAGAGWLADFLQFMVVIATL